MTTYIRAISFCAFLVGIPSAFAQTPAKSTTARIEKKTYDFKDAGKEMEYAQFVPGTYDKAKKYPLMVALHGLGSNPQQIMRYKGLTDLAEKHGYMVAAPMGYNSRGWYGARALVKGSADDPKNLAELSEKDVMNVLEIVKKDYSIDPDRVYLMGHSMGGGGTWHLGIKFSDLWAALAPIAPATTRPATDVEKIKHLPVMLVQGDKDVLVPVAGARRWAEQMKKLEMTHEYVEVKDGDHVSIAAQNLPKIFEFFDKYKRKTKVEGLKEPTAVPEDDKKADTAKLAVGKWDVMKSHEGGPPKGGVVEFTKDGKIKVSGEQDGMKQSFEGTYKIDGKKLTLTFKIGDKEQPVELTIDTLDEKTFATTSTAGKVELTRKK